nr:MAG TPA: hypothetical protein [Caudoviricetes sp.]
MQYFTPSQSIKLIFYHYKFLCIFQPNAIIIK